MRFFSFAAALAAFAAVAVADTTSTDYAGQNTVEFISQDTVTRIVHFTPNAGLAEIADIELAGNGKQTVIFPQGWIGNWFTYTKGEACTPGMLGEVAFNGWLGLTYFDVSAIVNPDDHNNVKFLYPGGSKTPLSGCEDFPCSNAYNQPDDIQTLSSPETNFVCVVGNAAATSRKSRRHPRHFVAGHSA